MSTKVLAKEFERLATRNAQLLHTDEGEGKSIANSVELSDEFNANLDKLAAIKDQLEKADRFDEIKAWGATPARKAAVFTEDTGTSSPTPPRNTSGSAGREFVESPQFKAWLNDIAPNGQLSDGTPIRSPKIQLNSGLSGAKNAAVLGGSTSGGAFFTTDYQNDLYVPYIQPMLSVRDLVINATTDDDLVSYPRAVAHTNAAAETAEATTADDPAISGATPGPYVVAAASGVKPEGSFTWEQVTAQVQAIAEGVPISRRALLNGGQIMSIIDDQLRFDIRQRINSQIMVGSGTAPNIRGIRNTTGILLQAFSVNVVETLRKAKTKVADTATGSGRIPNGAVLTPTSMETLDLFRTGGSVAADGPFLVNPYAERGPRLWGMTLVEEPGMTATKAVVGYFRDAVLWDRQQENVMVFDQHKDFAARNLLYLLAEWFGTFGVLQPKSFCDCTMA